MGSSNSMAGADTNNPVRASAISTVRGASKCARCVVGEAHLLMTTNTEELPEDKQKSTLIQPSERRASTT